jgi:cytochrome c peroxidase
MSDLEFHAMPFEQLGFGKNGFGVDYGRYNVTKDAADLYLFRTPPLINVEKTAPYTHSGALADLPSVIRAHTDPLAGYNGAKRTPVQRREDLARLLAWQGASQLPEPLTEREVSSLVAFLRSLSVEE